MEVSNIRYCDRVIANLLLITHQILGQRFNRLLGGTKRRFLHRLEQRLQNTLARQKHTVAREKDLSPEDFRRNYFDKSLPVIFSGAAANWHCTKTWSLDYFAGSYGKNDLLIVNSPGLTTRQKNSDHEFLTIKDLVSSIRSGGDKYLRFSPLMHENPELANGLDMSWLESMRGGSTFANTYYMFIGGKGHKTFLHADQPCNLFVQVHGEKKWTMFLPDDSICLYPEVTNTAYVKSPVDIDQPDHNKFPLLKYGRIFEADLRPGDVLYVPPHVWHQVENLSETIAVGYRFSSVKAALRSSFTFTLLRVLSTNPPIWKTRFYGKIDTNLIWAHTAGKIKEVMHDRELRRRGNLR